MSRRKYSSVKTVFGPASFELSASDARCRITFFATNPNGSDFIALDPVSTISTGNPIIIFTAVPLAFDEEDFGDTVRQPWYGTMIAAHNITIIETFLADDHKQ